MVLKLFKVFTTAKRSYKKEKLKRILFANGNKLEAKKIDVMTLNKFWIAEKPKIKES
jgi:hypothetical protein